MAATDKIAKFSRSAGDQRVTPKGILLEGTRTESYCSFDIAHGEDGKIAQALQRAVDDLHLCRSDLLDLRASGGVISLYVFWYPNGDTGEVLDLKLLASMVALGIELDLNVISLSDLESN